MVKVALDGKPVAEFPLVALEEVPPANLFGRAWDTVRLWFKQSRMSQTMSDRAAMIVYLNGQFLPLEDAKISVLDRGFIYGDGVYEVVPVYAPQPFRLPQHLARLQHSLDGIRLANPHTDAQWDALIARADRAPAVRRPGRLPAGHARRRQARPRVSRERGADGVHDEQSAATPSREQVERGVAVVTAEDNRWLRCDLKTTSLLGNVLMRQLAADAGAVETVMFRDGYLTEASASNVLIVRGGTIVAPPKDNLILPGITYDATLEFARDAGVRVRGAAGAAAPKRWRPTRCGCRRRRRKCLRSRRSTASRSGAASRDRCSAAI